MGFKIVLHILLSISSVAVFAQSNTDICKHINHSKAIFKATKTKAANSKTNSYHISSYDLSLSVDPEVKFISGNINYKFTPTDSALSQFYLDLSSTLRVDSVLYKNQLRSFTNVNNQLIINLNDTLLQGEKAALQVYYQGVPATNGLGTFVQNSYNGQDSIIWTLSQPYGASSWWPCKNTLTDKADSITLSITTPIGNSVASIGKLQSIDTLGNNVTFNWKSNYPIATYLVAFAVTNYEIHEKKHALGNDSLLYQHFLYPGDSLSIKQSEKVTPAFLHFFDSLFGPYPFIKEKYGHASFTYGGGMEHQTMSFMGSYGGELIGHELAHQWFGDYITCASWEDLWLNEAFATYSNALTYEFNIIHDDYYLPIILQGFRDISFLNPHASVFRTDTSSADSLFTRVPYYKGAGVLHMLRFKIGDDAFFGGLRNYLQDSKLAYSFARNADLQRHLEASSGMDLTEFFKDWYYGKGFPTYTALWSQENGELKIAIQQTQSDPSVYFFNMPIPYQVLGPNLDTTIILDPKFSGQVFSFPLNAAVDSLIFDPKKWIGAKSSIITSIEPLNSVEIEIDIYPNPSNSLVYITTPKELIIKTIDILDITGKLLQSKQFSSPLDISHLPNGSYILRIHSQQGILNKSIKISH